jgi:hypothetical protein
VINYTNTAGNTVIARYSVSTNAGIANTTGAILLTISQPYSNHNGGSLKFGPDGYLYIGMGDGGSGGDPENYAQNLTIDPANPSRVYLGKMLRIDVDSTTGSLPYGIPATNPYVGQTGIQEIWAIGLRNPWKFSFNPINFDLWIADVGQDTIEEINRAPFDQAGINYGWRCFEGNVSFNNTGNCSGITGTTLPIVAINHSTGSCSVTGGYVYNGNLYPNLKGKYLFTDFCNPKIGIVTSTGVVTYSQSFSGNFSTFGEDNNGELYIGDIGTTNTNGTIYKIIDTTLGVANFTKNEYGIYPNPSKNEIYIEKPSDSYSYPTEVEIFDSNGKQLLLQKTQNLEINTINTKVLSKGLYIMTIKNNLDAISTHKLLIE